MWQGHMPATRERWKKKKMSSYDDALLPRKKRQIMNIKFLVWRRRDVWSIVKVHIYKNEIDFCSSLVEREKNISLQFQEGKGENSDYAQSRSMEVEIIFGMEFSLYLGNATIWKR